MISGEQQKAYEVLLSNSNVFLSGKAGTGKSWLINKYIKEQQEKGTSIAICAPTGIAASNIGGVTLHKFLGLFPQDVITQEPKSSGVLTKTDVLIIDEISMCRIDLFEYVIKSVFKANEYRLKYNQEPIKVIAVGDFFQLPPVLTDRQREILKGIYPVIKYGFAFESSLWYEMNFQPIILKEVKRQGDDLMCKALNLIRVGNPKAIPYFNTRSKPSAIDNAIYLCGRNKDADEINTWNYNELLTSEREFKSDIKGDVDSSDRMIADSIKLKIGARVILLVNTGYGANGDLGTVLDLTESSVQVKFDHLDKPVWVYRHQWDIYNYEVKEGKLNKKIVGSISQIPLKLGYAITIHKSQGQTYDKVNLNPYCWEVGQLYVALSRAKSMNGLHLTYPISVNNLKSSKEVYEFYTMLINNNW